MICSMTAFARNQQQGEWGLLTCEIRSINHRYLDINLLLPESLRALEMPMRELIREKVKRGKIDCFVRYQANAKAMNQGAMIDVLLAQQLCEASQKIAVMLGSAASMSASDILRIPGVLISQEVDTAVMQQAMLRLLTKTMQELIVARGREGAELKNLFLQRINTMRVELAKVRERYPSVLVEQRERLLKRFTDARLELDPQRLEQEMVFFAQRLDVAEEIDRLETHFLEIGRILQEGGVIGRRLDFLMQELNREANTLSSKSTDAVMTHAAVEMKVLIEQIREQVQNIE